MSNRFCVVALVLLSANAAPFSVSAEDSQATLRRLLTLWRDYEGIAVAGVVTEFREGSVVDSKRVRAVYGVSQSPQKLRPMCAGFVVPNPGEPHLSDKELYDWCVALNNGLQGQFNREYISKPSPAYRANSMIMFNRSGLANVALTVFHRVVQGGIDGSSVDAGNVFGRIDEIVNENLRLEVLGDDEFLGYPCKRIRYSYRQRGTAGAGNLSVEQLITLEPSARVLETVSVNGKIDSIVAMTQESLQRSEILELKVIDGRLIATKVDVYDRDSQNDTSSRLRYRVTIDAVQPLPVDYHGLWNFDGPTGTVFMGPAESAIRSLGNRASGNALSQFALSDREHSLIPYTAEEDEKIRQFLVAHNVPVPTTVSWSRVAFYGLNLLAVGTLGWVFWRRVRAGD